MGELTVSRKKKKQIDDIQQLRYVRFRTTAGLIILLSVIIASVVTVAYYRLRYTNEHLYDTNRVRVQTVLRGLDASGTEQDALINEYDQLYIAKLKNTQYYFGNGLRAQKFDDAFVRAAASYAGADSAAVIDSKGNVYGSWQCDYDFTRNRFNMLRKRFRSDGTSEPFSISTEEGVRRFFGKQIAEDRILVIAQDWTTVKNSIENMTSWEAVLRGMISVDTVSIAVSLKDYTFLYNPIDGLTGKGALQNGVSIEQLTDGYEGEMNFGGETWCVVGKQWKDAMVYVMTKATTDMSNDMVLIFFLAIIFIMFITLTAAYGIIINRDNIKIGKMPEYITLLKRKTAGGEEIHTLNFNLSVARKLFPIVIAGVLATTGMCFYIQTVNSLSSIAYESNKAIDEISNKLANNTADAEVLNTEYKDQFLQKCSQIASILEENPQYIFGFDPEASNVHKQPVETDDSGQIKSGLDIYGNVCYSIENQAFLQEIARINNIEKISFFDEYGRIMVTNDDDWYFTMSGDKESQSYPFWEILAEHRDFVAQDLAYDDEGSYAQYIGNACYYYTVQQEDGGTGYVSKEDYENQVAGRWRGRPITRHRGLLQVSIAPERLRTAMETATLTYVADHTTVHGTGFTVICDTSPERICVYSPKPAEIGKSAISMGCRESAFYETGELYNGFETVNGETYFQTFKLVDDYFIGTSVPLATVNSSRARLTAVTFLVALIAFLINFLYTCCFGKKEEKMYLDDVSAVEERMRNEQDMMTVTMPSGKTRRVRTAASRWDAEYIPWALKTPEQKFAMITNIVFHIFAVFLFGCILVSRSGIYPIDAINYVFEGVWTKGFNIFAMTNCAIMLIMIFVISNFAELVIDNISVNIGSRAETLGHLLSSVIHYGVALFAVFYFLYLCGLDTGSLIASAGILSLVIGLGAQSMIQDILAGIFIVFEGEFRVGDIVTVGDWRGNVLEIGLRTTKIQDPSKNIKVFNNSNLSGIINMTKEASYAGIDVSIEYGESLERVEEVLARELPKVKKRLPAIMDGPFYRGVSALNSSSVDLKILAMCQEQNRIQLCRDLNRELFLIFKRNNINIPFPQVTLSYLKEDEAEEAAAAAQAEKAKAEAEKTKVQAERAKEETETKAVEAKADRSKDKAVPGDGKDADEKK